MLPPPPSSTCLMRAYSGAASAALAGTLASAGSTIPKCTCKHTRWCQRAATNDNNGSYAARAVNTRTLAVCMASSA